MIVRLSFSYRRSTSSRRFWARLSAESASAAISPTLSLLTRWESPSEAAERELLEESGYTTRAVKLLALQDRDRQGYPPHAWHVWKAIFLCELAGGEQQALGSETDDARFFARDAF